MKTQNCINVGLFHGLRQKKPRRICTLSEKSGPLAFH
jgi:hypothetical protein